MRDKPILHKDYDRKDSVVKKNGRAAAKTLQAEDF
jgi:hypothetical protein